MKFVDWDWRPAVLSDKASSAFAMLEPRGPWVQVDAADVAYTAGVMSEAAWRAKFEPEFGPLVPPVLADRYSPGAVRADD
ncbi:hypothetical protein [Blastochloris tepida]|uniref:Uncharacterized protein n=1 Tax=Blastochloris tepida TaxID=2233851 RepID=A0A348FYS0_9HYPH|nr:hypothetical protein [Blastochloris tepida]BBF92453.1 hypothetical protein BLTE_11380 [Blastochloris tepida]